MTRRNSCLSLIAALTAGLSWPVPSASAQAPADHPPRLAPEEELTKLSVPEGLEIQLVAAEPQVAQPLSITFDDRGRMWVLQYRQYPNPNGLKPVSVDQYLRTKYDRLPDPPPLGPQGVDRISVYEDLDGDGRADVVKDFLDDLNLASGMALGYGGVFVLQSPYLLFYADRDHDDRPDGPPQVLLTGFGMEDAHAFANSLTWGPDGWLYGAQGSTATADIRGIGFQQGIWRYHPRWDRFELFSEGGGNTWGVDFDRNGNLFPAGNTVEPLEHHVQGAYLVKGFGKHGPLHNPHTYGYFQPVLHHGDVGDSLSGGAIIYQGGEFPSQYNDACICPHTRHSACRWCTIEPRGSTFATRHVGDFVTSQDIWFRPVDMTVGPDGAVYIADWYDYNISHSSPKNRSEWYEPSRLDGRVWRVAPPGVAPVRANAFDLSRKSSGELVDLLAHRNDWYARQARRLLAERCDVSVVPALTKLAIESIDQRLALQGLWALYVTGAFDDQLAQQALQSRHEYVRAWTIRLLGDARSIPPALVDELARLAREDASVVVRSHLACTAKRLPARAAVRLIEPLLAHDDDADDVQMPLLIWWAIESKAITDADVVVPMLLQKGLWQRPLMTRFLGERITRRYFAEGSHAAYGACATVLQHARQAGEVDLALSGMLQALAGRKLDEAPVELAAVIDDTVRQESKNPRAIELALRLNLAEGTAKALQMVGASKTPVDQRLGLVRALGETRTAEAVPVLLKLLSEEAPESMKTGVLAALGYFADDTIGTAVLTQILQLTGAPQARGIELLCSRPNWARELLAAIEAKQLAPTLVPLDQVQRLRHFENDVITARVEKLWGKIQTATPFEVQGRINAVSQLLYKGTGDAVAGRKLFETKCATCHKLHGVGGAVGPELAAAERKNRELLVRNIVDPGAMIRQEFLAQIAVTKDGLTVTGLLAESTPETVTLIDARAQKKVLRRTDLEELKESPVSLMPEKLLDDLTDQQIRDLFAWLQSERDVSR